MDAATPLASAGRGRGSGQRKNSKIHFRFWTGNPITGLRWLQEPPVNCFQSKPLEN
jgi:hypothetical protein